MSLFAFLNVFNHGNMKTKFWIHANDKSSLFQYFSNPGHSILRWLDDRSRNFWDQRISFG
jgi:hypothetical protein